MFAFAQVSNQVPIDSSMVESLCDAISVHGHLHTKSLGFPGGAAVLGQPKPDPFKGADKAFQSQDGTIVLIDGWIDNREDVAAKLNIAASTGLAELYLKAVARWGDEADLKIVGHYASLVARPDKNVRMARSPIVARPLHWAWVDGQLVVASFPRLLSAAGLPKRLSQRALADSLFLNQTENSSWLENSWRLNVGELVHLRPNEAKPQPQRYWKPEDLPMQTGPSSPLLAQTEALLQEGIRASLADTNSPGVLLSGGLDSSNVAARVSSQLGPQKKLPSFTFVPSEAWDGSEPHWGYGDETERVRSFARLHPNLQPQFVDNADRSFDSDWERVFAAIGCAPPGLTNIGMYHGLFDAARKVGCDRLLSAEYGNQSFSIAADWAVAELVRKGRISQAWRQISGNRIAQTSRLRRFLRSGIAANLPDTLWKLWQALKGRKAETPHATIAAINPETAQRLRVTERALESRLLSPRNFPGTRNEWLRDIFARGDMGSGEIELAFEQIYGISQRDPTAYRPLVEHCLTLPTEMFACDGQDRWLAREMSRGHLPEAQRVQQKAGMHNADWHARMTPEIPRIRAELEVAARRPELQDLFDFDELFDRLDNWPDQPAFDDDTTYRLQMGIPIALMTARFVRHSYGWNE